MIITAVLILTNKKAGYIMGIIICFFSLFNFPVGTILGLYGLLVLISALKEKENTVLAGREYIHSGDSRFYLITLLKELKSTSILGNYQFFLTRNYHHIRINTSQWDG
jgi:hypothetical protein